MNQRERATRAKRLRDSEDFQSFISELREDAIAAFVNSGPRDSDARDEAHAQLRAIEKLVGTLDAAVAAQTHKDKKDNRK